MTAERNCAWCGADISHRGPRARSCGDKCSHHLRKKLVGRFREIRRCVECGGEYLAKAKHAKYCSSKCKRRPQVRRRSAERIGVFKNCAVCGSSFRAFASALTCSPECSQHYRRAINTACCRDLRRRHAAKAAIATLILPISKPSQD